MADQKISAMPSANVPLTGAELMPLVQSGVNVQSSITNFAAFARAAYADYGEFLDKDGAQTAPALTVTTLRINTTSVAVGMTRDVVTSAITVTNTGAYSVIISVQIANASANVGDLTLWPTINGVDVPDSASAVAIPSKHGSTEGHIVLTVQYTFQLTAGQNIGFRWFNESGNAAIVTFPASAVAPIHPAAPAVILSVIQIA